jgi:hypothetical protein
MANASAKKAAAAKKGASSVYLPVLVGFNVIHFLVLYSRGLFVSPSFYYRFFVTLIQGIITYVAYQGILQNSQHLNLTKKNHRKDELSGGLYLDILGVVMVSQLGGWVFPGYIHMMDSLLIVLPTGYGVYKWISQKMMNSNHQEFTSPQDVEAKKALEERRRQRAERRRQKRL